MISEEQQDLAALYVLGSLDGNEVAAFEASLKIDAQLRALVTELREAAGAVALTTPARQSRAELKQRVLREIARETNVESVDTSGVYQKSRVSAIWWPWAIAALFMIFSGILFYDRVQLRRELEDVRAADPLLRTSFVAMAPQNGAPTEAKAIVAWQPTEQSGVIRVTGLPAAGAGKDYQLWAVDADHKDPVSAGIVHVDANGIASVRFKPVVEARHVKAFAISLEREGGVPKAEGPILLVGTTTG